MSSTTFTADQERAVAAWLTRQRWFGDKSRALRSVDLELIDTIDLVGEQETVLLIVARCAFMAGEPSAYLLPIGPVIGFGHASDDPPVMDDALGMESFLLWLVSGFDERRMLSSPQGFELRWNVDEPFPSIDGPCRLLAVEQSNSSVLFGHVAISKVFRKLQPGINPDPEIVGYLSRQGRFHHAPRLIGTITAHPSDGLEQVMVAAFQEFVKNQGDCWSWLLGELGELAAMDSSPLMHDIRLLGERTGELHSALAMDTADTAFVPQPVTVADVRQQHHVLERELDQTFDALRSNGVRPVSGLNSLRESLRSRLGSESGLSGTLKTRVHGDYHLGQVLRTDNDFVIIDFEGEPSRPMAQRRALSSPLKDVAGMLRSLDYAVATICARDSHRAPSDVLRAWGERARESFIDGYVRAIESREVPIVPPKDDDFNTALDLFILEKALYEVRYELDNRPDWIEIPLGAIERLAREN